MLYDMDPDRMPQKYGELMLKVAGKAQSVRESVSAARFCPRRAGRAPPRMLEY